MSRGAELEYARRTACSAAAHERARRMLAVPLPSLAGGAGAGTEAGRWMGSPHPLHLARGAGARVFDLDGNEYIDHLLGDGALVAGHAHSLVVEAVKKQLDRGAVSLGTSGPPAPLAIEFGIELAIDLAIELRRRFPVLELVRFVRSGMEAAAQAVQLARAATGRSLLIGIERAGTTARTDGTAGTLAVPFNDLGGLAAALDRNAGRVAAVVVEPVLTGAGLIPPAPGYLDGVRELTTSHGALLILDETRSACTLGPGGAAGRFGVHPDLLVLGHAIAAGMCLGAFGGPRELMELAAPPRAAGPPDPAQPDPTAMAAALACLDKVLSAEAHAEMQRLAVRLAEGQRGIVEAYALPVSVVQVGALGGLHFMRRPPADYRQASRCDRAKWLEWWLQMLIRGVVPMGPAWFTFWTVSAAHCDEDIDRVLDAADEAFARIYGV